MSDQLLRVAQAEETALLAGLRRTVTFRRWEAVRAVIAAYQEVDHPPAVVRQAHAALPVNKPVQREGTLSATLINFSTDYFNRIGRRFPAPNIMKEVLASGIEVKGDKPVNTLASVLSHSPLFNNIRGKGYGLAEWGLSDGPATLPAHTAEQALPVVIDGQHRVAATRHLLDSNSTQLAVPSHQAAPDNQLAALSIGEDDRRIKEGVA